VNQRADINKANFPFLKKEKIRIAQKIKPEK
jgi:hypothetical protein